MATENNNKIVDFISGDKTYTVGNGTFSVFAGPCSIESFPQFLETAKAVKDGL